MDTFFWFFGLIVTLVLGAATLWLLVETAIGFVNAVSFHRFLWAAMKAGNRKPRWDGLAASFAATWLERIGYRNTGNLVVRGANGSWRGIGDWSTWQAGTTAGAAIPSKTS